MWRLAAALDPQALHRLASKAPPLPPPRCRPVARLGPFDACGYAGAAAGLDKTGSITWLLARYAGFVVVGSVTAGPRQGNRGRVLVRLRNELAAVNAMGLPSPGIAALARRIAMLSRRFPIILSVAPFNQSELVALVRAAARLPVAAIEVNLSSPTFRGSWRGVTEAVQRVAEAAEGKPVLIKLSPLDDARAWARAAAEAGVGLTLINTLPITTKALDPGYGGVSGAPIYKLMLRRVRTALSVFDGPVMAVGGVCTCSQARELAAMGVSAIQALTCPAMLGPSLYRVLSRCFEEGVKK